MGSKRRAVRRIAQYGRQHRRTYVADDLARRDEILRDWRVGLRFWFDRAFYRGRRNQLSERMRDRSWRAFQAAMGSGLRTATASLRELNEEGWLREERWHRRGNPVRVALVDGQVNNRNDRLLVLSTLAFLPTTGHLNITRWAAERIRAGEVQLAYQTLLRLNSVGPKIASLFARDVVDVFALGRRVKGEDRALLQPVDTWVRQVAAKIGIPTGANDEELRSEMLAACDSAGVDPVRFNQGIWYVGYHALDIVLDLLAR